MKESRGAKAEPMPYVGAVLAAAGSSGRMDGTDKQLAMLCDAPVVARSAMALGSADCVREIVIVCREETIPLMWRLTKEFSLSKVTAIVAGGGTRQQSVFAGVGALSERCGWFAVHDGARPFVTQRAVVQCVALAAQKGAACAAVTLRDTIKLAGQDGAVLETKSRENLFCAQTPQVFERSLYLSAMEKALAEGLDFTDDCQLVENIGTKVYLSRGDSFNFKITTPDDLVLAEALAEFFCAQGSEG